MFCVTFLQTNLLANLYPNTGLDLELGQGPTTRRSVAMAREREIKP
jgi:hypothetical protein